jgi:protein translocase SecG subunit
MLRFIWLIINILLILLILIRIPNNAGLTSFATKSELLGSPTSTERFLNSFTWLLILFYFALATQLNFST